MFVGLFVYLLVDWLVRYICGDLSKSKSQIFMTFSTDVHIFSDVKVEIQSQNRRTKNLLSAGRDIRLLQQICNLRELILEWKYDFRQNSRWRHGEAGFSLHSLSDF